MTFLLDPNFAITLAFFALFLIFGRLFKKNIVEALEGYHLRVTQPIQEARMLLQEAENALEEALKHHEAIDLQAKEILQLAEAEAQDILEQAEMHYKEAVRESEHLFQQQTLYLQRHFEEECLHAVTDIIEKGMLEEVSQEASLPFLAHHLEASLEHKQSTEASVALQPLQ